MKSLDFAYLKCLGYHPRWNGRNSFDILVDNERYYFDEKGNPKMNVEWMIPIGDEEETGRVLENLTAYVVDKQEVIRKIKDLLSVSEEEKKKTILDNFDKFMPEGDYE